MQGTSGTVLILVTMATVMAAPQESRTLGRYVSDCDSGDVCREQQRENDTVSSLDGTLFCCSNGNSISFSVSSDYPGDDQTQSRGFFSSNAFDGTVFSRGVNVQGRSDGDNENSNSNSNSNNPPQGQMQCQCREVNEREIENYFRNLRNRFWNRIRNTWGAASTLFQ